MHSFWPVWFWHHEGSKPTGIYPRVNTRGFWSHRYLLGLPLDQHALVQLILEAYKLLLFTMFSSHSGVVNIYDYQLATTSPTPRPLKAVLNLSTASVGLKFNSTSEILAMVGDGMEKAVKLVSSLSRTILGCRLHIILTGHLFMESALLHNARKTSASEVHYSQEVLYQMLYTYIHTYIII